MRLLFTSLAVIFSSVALATGFTYSKDDSNSSNHLPTQNSHTRPTFNSPSNNEILSKLGLVEDKFSQIWKKKPDGKWLYYGIDNGEGQITEGARFGEPSLKRKSTEITIDLSSIRNQELAKAGLMEDAFGQVWKKNSNGKLVYYGLAIDDEIRPGATLSNPNPMGNSFTQQIKNPFDDASTPQSKNFKLDVPAQQPASNPFEMKETSAEVKQTQLIDDPFGQVWVKKSDGTMEYYGLREEDGKVIRGATINGGI